MSEPARKCSVCDGARLFYVLPGKRWRADQPEPETPYPEEDRCWWCDGTGDEPSVDRLRSRMIGTSP